MTNLAKKYDYSYFNGLKYLIPKESFIGVDTIELQGFISENYINKLGWELKSKFKNNKLEYKYIKFPHGGELRFRFNPKKSEVVNKSTGEIKNKWHYYATIIFSVGGFLFGNNTYLGDHFLINKCFRIIESILTSSTEYSFPISSFWIKRLDIAANYDISYRAKAVVKNTVLPKYWKSLSLNKGSWYYNHSITPLKTQKQTIIYNKKNLLRIETRFVYKKRKYNSTPFNFIIRKDLGIEPKANMLYDDNPIVYFKETANFKDNEFYWYSYQKFLRYYVAHISQLISIKQYDKRQKRAIFKCRDTIYRELFTLWKNSQKRLSMGSIWAINP